MQERSGVVTFSGNPLTLLGNDIEVGAQAPDFMVLANDLTPRSLADYKGKTLIISSVPSLDTGVCDLETRRFNSEAASLSDDIKILTISCDLPFAQSRWCGAAGVDTAGKLETLSDHKNLAFGLAYGVAIKELRLLTRAVFVVNKEGRVIYKEIVPEISSEPNYENALQAARDYR